MNTPMRWYHSVALKSSLVAFVATHIPLLGLIALILFWPDLLSPWGVFLAALVLTLAATGLVVGVLWRMFRPLRQAADGLKGFMTGGGATLRTGPGTQDEIGRLVAVLVRALAHLDRSRGALLHSSSVAVGRALAEGTWAGLDGRQWLVLLEIDRPDALDGTARMDALLKIHQGMDRVMAQLLQAGEIALPWGRGRFLALLNGSNADTIERLHAVCKSIEIDGSPACTATAVVEPEVADAQARAAALQRLEHKLFARRGQGLVGTVA